MAWSPDICAQPPELDFFYAFADALEDTLIDGVPLHVARPTQSQFKGFTKEDFNSRGHVRLRREFSKQNFIVRDKNFKSGPLELDDFAEFAPLNQGHVIHDYSLAENGGDRYAIATLKQIYDEHVRGDDGKILNLLELPTNDAVKPHPLRTDVTAFMATRKSPLSSMQDFPVREVRFVLIATKDATHGLHHDSDGFCTHLSVWHGLKLWVIAVPLDPSVPPLEFFGDLIQFIRKWSQIDPNRERYRFEAVVLCPGDEM